jgi:hypothetical protein
MKRIILVVVVLAIGVAAWRYRSQLQGKVRRVPVRDVKEAVVDSAESVATVAREVANTAIGGAVHATNSSLDAAKDGARHVGDTVNAGARAIKKRARA